MKIVAVCNFTCNLLLHFFFIISFFYKTKHCAAERCLSLCTLLKHEWFPFAEVIVICWVICNSARHVTVNHAQTHLLTYLLFPCLLVRLAKEYSLLFFFLFIFFYSRFSLREWQTSFGGLWLPLERWCVLPASPVGSRLVTTAKHKREKEKRGKQVGPLNSDELSLAESCEGKQKKGSERYALTWDGSQQLCALCAISIEMWQASSKEEQMHLQCFCDWMKFFFFLLDNNEGPEEWKGFNETECDRKCHK